MVRLVERVQSRLEPVQGRGSGYDFRQSVPQPDRWRDEGVHVHVCVSAAEWQQVLISWPSGGHNRRVVEGRAWNVDQVVDSSVHKHKLGICCALLELRPSKWCYHFTGTTCPVVVPSDKSCCPPLDRFQFADVCTGVGVPDCCGILHVWSDQRLVALCLHI